MRAHLGFSLSLMATAFALANTAWAHPEYRVTIVAPADSDAVDINNAGVVVGNFPYSGSTRAFLNRGNGMVKLGALRGVTSSAVAINNHGKVLGQWANAAGQARGFVYHRATQRDIGMLPGYATRFTDINDHGYISAIGLKLDWSEGTRSFLRAPNGTYRNIGTLPFETPLTDAYALNNSNTITGASGPLMFPEQPVRAIIWSKGIMRDIGGFGYEPNAGMGINHVGQVTGYASVAGPLHDRVAILYDKGRLIDIDRRPAGESRFSEGAGINNHGHIVGYADHLGGFVYRGKQMQSLNALIDPKLLWDIRFPRAINDRGQIAATGYRNRVQYAVRLDLIRPHLLRAPELVEDDRLAVQTTPAKENPAEAEAEAKAETAAQAREVVQVIAQ